MKKSIYRACVLYSPKSVRQRLEQNKIITEKTVYKEMCE